MRGTNFELAANIAYPGNIRGFNEQSVDLSYQKECDDKWTHMALNEANGQKETCTMLIMDRTEYGYVKDYHKATKITNHHHPTTI